MPVVLDMLLFLAILFVFSSIGGYCVTKFIPQDVKVALRPVSQQTFNVTGMMFAILLGFFIAQSMRDYTNSHNDIINEANSLGEVFRDARGFSEVDRVRIRTLCRQYADSVINDEWNLLVENKENSKSQEIMNELWNAALSVQPHDQREQAIYDGFFKAMNDLGGYRRVRTANNPTGLSLSFWIIIAVGASALVTLTFLMAPEHRAFHTAVLACFLVPLTLNIYLLADYSHPFAGLVTVRPVMFESLKRKIMSQDDSAPHFIDPNAKNEFH